MEKAVLKVRMLGGFSLELNDKTITIERNSATKVNQLLQLLLFYTEGIPREQLVENLFGNEEVSNTSNSLRALVFRLRKALASFDLPEDDFVYITKGVYRFTDAITVICDAHEFDKVAESALNTDDEEKQYQLLIDAADIYAGDYLPMLASSDWAVVNQIKLKKLYSDVINKLCEMAVNKSDYELLLKVSKKAAELYPYNEWQGYEMQALIELGDKKRAMKLYEETERLMFEELGVAVSSKMSQQLNRLGQQVKNSTDLIGTVQKNLEDVEDREGAFFCTYPVFTESYKYIKRVIRRTGQSAWLMLCTITDGKGYALENGGRLESLTEELASAIRVSVRGGDMFTRYSDNQFLILLLGITKEDCTIVQDRINSNMDKESRKKYIQYHLAPVSTNPDLKNQGDKKVREIIWGLE